MCAGVKPVLQVGAWVSYFAGHENVCPDSWQAAVTFPVVLSVEEEEFPTAAKTFDVAMPASVSSGDLLLMVMAHDAESSVAIATPSGWSNAGGAAWGSSNGRWNVFYKSADGSEGGTTVTVDIQTSSDRPALALVFRIQAGTWDTGTAPILGSANGTDANPDPPNLASGFGATDNLWIAVMVCDQDRTVNAYPTNYASNQSFAWISGQTDDHTLAAATREVAANAEDPGTFTISASDQWGARTVAVKGVAGGGGGGQPPRTMHQARMRRAA